MAGALIITAELGRDDFAWLEGLRRANYPPDRNHVPAHLTMFHALPPSTESEVRSSLSRLAAERPPSARIEGLMDLSGGVAFRVVSDDLDRIRRDLAREFHGLLSAQDAGGWRPHVTIQNKVPLKEARALIVSLERGFTPRPLGIRGLGLHRYLDGPWERLAVWSFRGAS
jgi:hypothetical protein